MQQNAILHLALLFSTVIASCSCEPVTPETVEERASRIHDAVLTIDTHVDTPMRLPGSDYDLSVRHDVEQRGGQVDFPRMKEGGLDAIFFAVFVGQGKRDSDGHMKAKERALSMFDSIHEALRIHGDLAELALDSDDAARIEKTGKRAIYIGIENGCVLGKSLAMLETYYGLGARYITLCHSKNNDICDSSTDEAEHGGLSPFGKQVVEAMNRMGVMVDVSHIADSSFDDVLETSKAPVFASHSCARAICDHPRNLTDDMLKRLAAKGGVIQLCVLSDYVKKPEPNPERDAAMKTFREKYPDWSALSDAEKEKARAEWYDIRERHPRKRATVADAVDHIDHIVKVAGIDHVGIGTDFDGGGGLADCRDASELPNITLELVRRGYTEQQIRKIWGGNLFRVFREVEKRARELQTQGEGT